MSCCIFKIPCNLDWFPQFRSNSWGLVLIRLAYSTKSLILLLPICHHTCSSVGSVTRGTFWSWSHTSADSSDPETVSLKKEDRQHLDPLFSGVRDTYSGSEHFFKNHLGHIPLAICWKIWRTMQICSHGWLTVRMGRPRMDCFLALLVSVKQTFWSRNFYQSKIHSSCIFMHKDIYHLWSCFI